MDKLSVRESEVLTVAEVAMFLRCSKAHVCKIINGQVSGTAPIPSISVGRRKIVRKDSLLQWMSQHEDASLEPSLEDGAGGRA